MFCGSPSQYLWEDERGVTHTIHQGEGGEQGDAMMLLVYSLGQQLVQDELREDEALLAFLDDTHLVTSPERTTTVFATLQGALLTQASASTQAKQKSGIQQVKPPGCNVLQMVAETFDPTAVVWRGSGLPTQQQGMKVLGTPLGHPEFVKTNLELKSISHQTFLDRIPLLQDVQASWLLLVHCAAARANYMTRVVEPGATQEFCDRNDGALWQCLSRIMQIPATQPDDVRETASMPMVLGGLGLRSARRTSQAAYWASWADCLPMVQQRHPWIAALFVANLSGQPHTPFLRAASEATFHLARAGFEAPTWHALARGARPGPREPEEIEPGAVRRGWQHNASSEVEKHARIQLFSRVSDQVRALVRSQGGPGAGAALTGGPGAGAALTALPTGRETTIPSHLFRVILLRRLRQPLPFTGRVCRCGRLIDPNGHHRAACARTGVLGRRGFALESAVARICREARGRVRTNVFVRDMDLPIATLKDARRLEVVVDGLPLHGGAQLAVDTTLESALHGDGRPRRGAGSRRFSFRWLLLSPSVTLRPPLARRAPVVHLSAGCSQRPLGVTVEDSLGTALYSQDAASVGNLVKPRPATYGLGGTMIWTLCYSLSFLIFPYLSLPFFWLSVSCCETCRLSGRLR